MPGKSQQSGRGKQDSSKERLSPASQSENVRKITIWPEWTEAELAAEKWDLGGGKGRAKSATVFEDPDGTLLPPSLLARGKVVWKRPSDAALLSSLGDENPVVVLNPDCSDLDLVSSNSHLMHSEFMCWMLSQLIALWENRHILAADVAESEASNEGGGSLAWRPWEHIQPHPKGTPAPQISQSGKYCVRLFWMGCWRKVTVDDLLPFIEEHRGIANENGTPTDASSAPHTTDQVSYVPLFPRTANPVELWPAVLYKAVLKIAALDYSGGSELSEFGDCSVIHMLTGWIPTLLPVKTDSLDELWDSLVDALPMWRRGDPYATEKQRRQNKCLVMTGFTSVVNKPQGRLVSASQAKNISTSEATLKEAGLLPPDYDLHHHPSYPMLLSQVRAEPLVLPPAEPPLPMLQAPYYLGLKHRAQAPGEPAPPPTPPPVEPRFLEVVAPFFTHKKNKGDWNQSSSTEAAESNKSSADEEDVQSEGSGEIDHESNPNEDDKKIWMDYLDFTEGFQTLYVFNCSTNFDHRECYVDLSQTIEGTTQTSTSAQPSKKATSASQLSSASKVSSASVKPQNLLFVDSPDPVTLYIVLTSLSNWREGQRNTHTTTQRHPIGPISQAHAPSPPVGSSEGTAAEHQSNTNTAASSSEGQAPERKYVIAGSLIVEAYSWKSVQCGKFVLRLTSTGTKGTTLSLPPGRHVFKLHVRAPVGHHLEIVSYTTFALTDQDGIFAHLNKESSLYLAHGENLVKSLLTSASNLSDAEKSQGTPLQPLLDFYSNFFLTKDVFTLLLASVVQAWAKQASQYGLSNKMLFAWKAFLYKAFGVLEQQAPSSPQGSADVDSNTLGIPELRRQLHIYQGVLEEEGKTVPDSWTNREATVEEGCAAKVIQGFLHLYLSHRREQSMKTDSSSYRQLLEELEASIPLIEPSVVELGILTLNGLFRLRPALLERFPFCEDEKSRAFSKVYTGSFPPLPPNSWTVVFREVFHIKESQCIMPLFECPVSSYLFRVIDNDTNSEVPRIFHSTPPHIYQPNSRGYTFQAEAWNNSSDGLLSEGGRWSFRIVSSNPALPTLDRGETTNEEVASTFYSKEVVDYCLPDRDGCLFRYFLTVSQDCPVSVQLCTSKKNAICRLEIMDRDVSKVTTQGRGNCTIPLYLLETNQEILSKEGHRTGTAHKYVVCATVLRDSWPTSESAWPYISVIKSMEKLDEQSGSKPGSAKKGKKDKGGGKKGATPQQSSSQLNQVTEKPHWSLRIVTKSSDKDVLEVKKDTEREDNLKGMVQAWEVEQPGRSKKAQESRQKFLEARAIKENTAVPSAEEDQSTAAASVVSEGSTIVPHPNTGPVKIVQMDLSPYIVKHEGQAKRFDEAEERARLQVRQKLFKDYRNKRQEVMKIRNEDRQQRNEAKVKQLEQAEEWQENLEKLRNKLNAGREAIREKHLAKEKARQEAELAAVRAQEELQATAGRDSKMAKGAKGKGKKK